MKGEAQVIERLNEALFLELGAVNQYWVHYRILSDWGVQKLAAKERAESIEEMHHADKLIERIIFLEGHPNLQRVAPLRSVATDTFSAAPGNVVKTDDLVRWLEINGFVRASTVRETGEYAMRGGIETYMQFALDYPELFQLCFEHPVPGFVPSEESMRVSWTLLQASREHVAKMMAQQGVGTSPAEVEVLSR